MTRGLPSEEKLVAGDASRGNSGRKPLRVGLLIDSFIQPRWVRQVFEDIMNSPVAEVVLVIKNQVKETSNVKRELLGKLRANKNYLLYAGYTKIDEAVFKVQQD